MKWLVGFRKWTMAVIFLAVAVGLLVTGVIDQTDWLDNVSEVMVAFMATNVGEHLIAVGKKWIEERNKKDIKVVMDETKQ